MAGGFNEEHANLFWLDFLLYNLYRFRPLYLNAITRSRQGIQIFDLQLNLESTCLIIPEESF